MRPLSFIYQSPQPLFNSIDRSHLTCKNPDSKTNDIQTHHNILVWTVSNSKCWIFVMDYLQSRKTNQTSNTIMNLIMHTAFSFEVLQTATLTPFSKAWSISLCNLIREIHQSQISGDLKSFLRQGCWSTFTEPFCFDYNHGHIHKISLQNMER
jgi:hypothetical protein